MKKSICMTFLTILALLATISPASADIELQPQNFAQENSLEALQQSIMENGYSYTVAPNHIFNMSPEEKKEFFNRRAPAQTKALRKDGTPGPLEDFIGMDLPEKYDSRDVRGRSYIGPVRDQGACGSCYSFGAAAAAEGVYNFTASKFNNDASDFSEAFIAFCLSDNYDGFDGCDGSDYEYEELDGLVDLGVMNEISYPYSDVEQTCPITNYTQLTRFKSWHRIECGDIEAIKTAIMLYGVVDASVQVSNAFQAYSGGVYADGETDCEAWDVGEPCYYAPTNHIISLVGWDDNPPDAEYGCWILRNSWGENWGENGYMRIEYESAHVACEAAYLVYEGNGPEAVLAPSSNITATKATLNIRINPGGLNADYHFEYGPTSECLQSTPVQAAGSGSVYQLFSANLAGLDPLTKYFFRGVSTNANGAAYTELEYFETSGDPMSPFVETGGAITNLTQAELAGLVNPHGEYTDYWFEYGTDDSYGTSTAKKELGGGSQTIGVSTVITSLAPVTTYHYRIVA